MKTTLNIHSAFLAGNVFHCEIPFRALPEASVLDIAAGEFTAPPLARKIEIVHYSHNAIQSVEAFSAAQFGGTAVRIVHSLGDESTVCTFIVISSPLGAIVHYRLMINRLACRELHYAGVCRVAIHEEKYLF